MWTSGRIILELAAAAITAGGLFDVFTPNLPPNLVRLCGASPGAQRLARELLRALGGSLVAIGAATAILIATSGPDPGSSTLLLILLLVAPAEGTNAFCMLRIGSPFYIPLGFVLLTVLGVVLAWPHPAR
jgi:hypothetical protein